ncbi:MAG: hypothetical protein A2504_09040 [Bdellovibrionales bacterium RIFOXYD12_FULL_39_22]|nr:MAG: hypothetical protein A2385_17510 [Bdellovibrionales bacterium RIFOXYB1_FULL_39_21]OFZ41114.1 MAG: hypothetical protein A2485_00435 [Bdellovibrionales bacterium RIFOXYC12_FULL_39_17]OFZ50327.1 MAG: hypothetical protein A2404_07750 [Bdellovibrionales bacterium RIFOXYC1_FULL_39_130]OFZ73422.1 MAG: hypothetical protein A2451_07365 [Bdellovibrionales bacterium RIFOXYC2_FULL_39_8]OFZ75128.1 MAG: hypothetical protein A2560_16445 [Bdellovibrionales bacterium RIFOXYD1_FULL_39_84]OFZ92230.1 MAG:
MLKLPKMHIATLTLSLLFLLKYHSLQAECLKNIPALTIEEVLISTDLEKLEKLIAKINEKILELKTSEVEQELTKSIEGGREFSCEERKIYIKEKIDTSLTPLQLIKDIAKNPPQVLFFGDTHDVIDYVAWFTDIVKVYKKENPKLDCLFVEEAPKLEQQKLIISAKRYYDKNKDIETAVKSYAKDHNLPFKSFKSSAKPGDAFSMTLGDDLWVNSYELEMYFLHNIKIINIDNRTHNRDLFMSEYISSLFSTGQCHYAISMLGKGHLRQQKFLLNKNGITSKTVGFQNLNAYEREIDSFFQTRLPDGTLSRRTHKVISFLDYETCPPFDKKPNHAFAVKSNEDGPRVNLNDDFKFRWNSFDAQIIGPVFPTGPSNESFEHNARIMDQKE